jgi:integrase
MVRKLGTVTVEGFKGVIRLRWQTESGGKRYCMSIGLPDTPTNRAIAQLKADVIERDIEYQMFDETLTKYRGELIDRGGAKVWELFERFTEFKRGKVYKQTLSKYYGLLGHLKEYFPEKRANALTPPECDKFKDYLTKHLTPVTVKERLTLLSAAWKWGQERKMVSMNVWDGMAKHIKMGAVPPPNPFSPTEIQNIIRAFRTHPRYAYYGDYAEFLLGTGCRPGEAIALTWGDLTDDCSQIWFGKSHYRGDDKELKAGKAGYVPLSQSLSLMLRKRRPPSPDVTELIFPAPKGGHLDDANFRNRAWTAVLEAAGVPYRKPYTTRKTLISYWLSQGEDPVTVAKFTRTSVRMIYQHYAGYIPSNAKLPNLLGDIFAAPTDGTGE